MGGLPASLNTMINSTLTVKHLLFLMALVISRFMLTKTLNLTPLILLIEKG